MATDGSGGVFLSALREKNSERRRAVDQNGKSLYSIKSMKSFLGFTKSTRSMTGLASNKSTVRLEEMARESDTNGGSIPNAQEEGSDNVQVQGRSNTEDREPDDSSIAKIENTAEGVSIAKIIEEENPPTDNRPSLFREVSSMGEHAFAKNDRPERIRRASTSTDARRESSSEGVYQRHLSIVGKERTLSVASVDQVYRRSIKDSWNFEMNNPLLHPTSTRIGYEEDDTPQTEEDLKIAKQKRASLYQSASHIDTNQLLTRRNTRANRASTGARISMVDEPISQTSIPRDMSS